MSLTNDERTTLVTLELKKAHETYEEIAVLIAANKWSGAANRLYYAVFHAINALLIRDGHSVNTHKAHMLYLTSIISKLEFSLLNMVAFTINYRQCARNATIIVSLKSSQRY